MHSRLKTFQESVAAILLGGLALTGCGFTDTQGDKIGRAKQAMAEGKFLAAVLEARRVLDEVPADAEAQQLLISALTNAGDYAGAENALKMNFPEGGRRPDWANELVADLAIRQGHFASLQQKISTGELKLPGEFAPLYRAHALKGSGRYAEAALIYQSLVESPRTGETATIGLAESLAASGQPSRAIYVLKGATRKHPESPALWLTLGQVHLASGNGNEALVAFNEALKHKPEQLPAVKSRALFNLLATERITKGDLASAEEIHHRMISLFPQDLYTRLLDARLLLARGNSRDATGELQKLLSKSPEFFDAELPLIASLLADGSVEQALLLANLRLARDSDNLQLKLLQAAVEAVGKTQPATLHRHLAVAAAQAACLEVATARSSLEKALKIDPKSADALAAKIQLEQQSGRLEEALQTAKALRNQIPDSPVAVNTLASVQLALKLYKEAATNLEALWAMEQSATTAVSLHQARLLGKSGDSAEPLQRWLKTHPNDLSVRFVLAEALKSSGRHKEAQMEYERILSDAPNNAALLNNLAWLYYQLGDSRAERLARKAYALAPQSSQVADTLGWILVEKGNVVEGTAILKTAFEGAPELANISYHYAAAVAKNGDRVQARSVLSTILAQPDPFASREAAEQLLKEVSK